MLPLLVARCLSVWFSGEENTLRPHKRHAMLLRHGLKGDFPQLCVYQAIKPSSHQAHSVSFRMPMPLLNVRVTRWLTLTESSSETYGLV